MRVSRTSSGSDLEKKLKVYRDKGEAAPPRVIFRAGITEFMQLSKDTPHGWIPIYDDTTAKDVHLNFLGHKRERVAYLRNCGIRKRKYITSNASRDHEWFKMAGQYDGTPDFTEISKTWAKKNERIVARMVLKYLWTDPNNAESEELRQEISTAQQSGKIFDSFFRDFMIGKWRRRLKDDRKVYLGDNLPRLIREAVQRFKKT